METKKSYKADLDNRRASGFMLGLVVVLSLFLVALEFTSDRNLSGVEAGFLDDVAQDVEMMPVMHRDDMRAVAESPAADALTDKVEIVDRPTKDSTGRMPVVDKNRLLGLFGVGLPGVTDIPVAELQPVKPADDDNPLNFRVVEKLPEFPGGMSAFVQWLNKHLKYPASAQRAKREGTVLVAFVINKDGSITDHKVVKPAATEFDREALRVIRLMPKWTAGEDHGKPCRTYFCIPIVFKL